MLQVIDKPIGSAPVAQLSMWSLILEKAKGTVFSILVSPLGSSDLFSIAIDMTGAWQTFIKLFSWPKGFSFAEKEFIACFLHHAYIRD